MLELAAVFERERESFRQTRSTRSERKKNVDSETKKGMVRKTGEDRGLTEIISKATNPSELALPC